LVKTGEVPGTEQSILDKIESGNSFTSLLWGTMGAAVITVLMYLVQWFKPDGTIAFPHYKSFCKYFCRKEDAHGHVVEDEDEQDTNDDARPLLSLPIAIDSFLHGMGRIFPALIVLNLAWAVGSIMVDVGADRLFSRWIVGGVSPESLPTLSFLISFLMALATGTSWGTMTILFPLLLVPTYIASNGDEIIFYATTAGVLSGSVAGDHVSPISDTTVLSALACDCQLLRHVTTQTPYVVVVVIFSTLVGTIPIGYDAWPNIVGILFGFALLALFSYFICVPVESNIGRYDIVTEIMLKFKKDPELLALREDTKKFYAGEVVKEVEELLEEEPTMKEQNDIQEEGKPLKGLGSEELA
jgi:Na+/H+ antiporter family